jgi:acetyl-CoA acetyltransferase
MTGARIAMTMINSLRWHDKQFGLESMCVGGGPGHGDGARAPELIARDDTKRMNTISRDEAKWLIFRAVTTR